MEDGDHREEDIARSSERRGVFVAVFGVGVGCGEGSGSGSGSGSGRGGCCIIACLRLHGIF